MADKKHPILTAVVILLAIGLFLCISMFIVIKMVDPASKLTFSDKIGVIPVDGAILDSRLMLDQLVAFREDNNIKAIIIRINSPGGAVGPSQELYREIQKTIQTKKVVASLGGVAASGGYYIASAADKIVANPGTLTGSIGVVMEFFRFEDLLNKIGVRLEVLKSGEFKDIGSPHRELTDRDREIISGIIADIQNQFVQAVASGRNLPVEKVNEIADGRVFSGSKAKELDLVDVLGNFNDAVNLAKEIAGIKGDAILVYPKKSRLEIWESFVDGTTQSVARALQAIKPRLAYEWCGY
ncbi:Signal peptide peptidase SppA, 36K type [uncultured Desulfobacterium sp.]|uniref:Signal peptide peptidase SppA, 36K type n=1 Tax=uncultured Desulfobacterium sp. TaxID=201089 RepID=A0A445MWE2_9BACT|nr:Signal peptide peptidase SppA, 36K type [uncultured Desulfobacterium sp.]